MATMTTVTALTSRRALAPTVRQGRLSRAGASDSTRSSVIRIRRCRAGFRLPGAAIVARASDDVHARSLDAASDGVVPPMATEPRTDDAVRDDAVRKLAVALAATAAMAHCDVALAADAAAEVAAASGFWGLAPVVWLKSGWTGFTGLLASPEAKDIYVYTIKTLISWGVPAVTVGIVAFFVIGSSRKNKSGADKPGGAFSLFGGGRAGEKPSPFVIKRLNDRLDSYSYAFDQAVIGKEAVDAAKRRTAFADKYAAVLGKLTAKEREAVTAAKQQWAREDARLRAEMASLSRKIRADAVRAAEGKKKNKGDDDKAEASEASEASDAASLDDFPLLDEVEDAEERALYAEAVAAVEADSSGEKSGEKSVDDANDKRNPILEKLPKLGGGVGGKLAKLAAKRSDAEAKYVTAVAKALPAHKRARLMKLLADPRMSPGWEGDRDPLAVPASRMDRRDKPHVFVLQFFGDVRASQASNLREEVTAVLRSAKKSRGDEVVLVLNTGGGTVTGYGLAAAQLTRLKDAGIKLTICVEQVAASGGYMMACTADRLVASPFAVLGSIGVISEIPNVYERLKKEGVEFQTVTAGKFKRTLTPTKKVEKADVEKSKADIEDVLTLFKTFVKQQRPKLVIDEVATGETWFGADAMKRDLCDELKTTDDVLLELLAAGREIFSVKYRPPQSGPAALLAGGGGGDDDARMGAAAGGGGGGWGALRAAALGLATFAQAAGGSPGSVGLPFSGSYLRGGEALAVDGADAAGKVMARGGRYLGEEDYVGGGIFSAVDNEDEVYF